MTRPGAGSGEARDRPASARTLLPRAARLRDRLTGLLFFSVLLAAGCATTPPRPVSRRDQFPLDPREELVGPFSEETLRGCTALAEGNAQAAEAAFAAAPSGDSRRLAAEIPVTYLAFDLLFAGGRALTDRPYTERRARLDELAVDGPRWQTPPAFIGIPGADVRAVSRQHGLEGIMAKRLASRYEAGRRSSSWRKIKNVQRQEFVIGGYRPGEGVRTDQIGSLIVGVYGPEGLTFAGHVGTGFTRQTLAMLMGRLAPLRRKATPFGDTIPPDQARGAVWTEPEVVIEAEFALWTSAGRLRAATYRGIRDDKNPADVVRE